MQYYDGNLTLANTKDDVKSNLEYVKALTVFLNALAVGEVVQLEGFEYEMYDGKIYHRMYAYEKGEIVKEKCTYMGDNSTISIFMQICKEMKDKNPQVFDDLVFRYAAKMTLNGF